jgi:predicted TIM-barrel fold metal-dependent hydrolase
MIQQAIRTGPEGESMNEQLTVAADSWDRRRFLAGAGAATAVALSGFGLADAAPASPIPIIDTHIHLFDASRPQGAPYKGPKEFTSHVSLPREYREMAAPHGVVGAIVVEASGWIEDNLWILEVSQADTIMVGAVGRLAPEKAEFAEYLERYHKNPLYRGIRVNQRFFPAQLDNPAFIESLKLLAQADLVMDTANPSMELLHSMVRLNDQVPDLRIVIDHLPVMDPKPAEMAEYQAVLAEIHSRPNIYVKLSEILHRVDSNVALDLASHRERLDYLMSVFGEDRVLFGSDYPNSVGTATFEQVLSLVKQYFATKPRSVAEKYFWKNSVRCYKWQKRSAAQPVSS